METVQSYLPLIISIAQVFFLIGLGLLIMKIIKSEVVRQWCGVALQVLGVMYILTQTWQLAIDFGVISYS